MMECIMKEKESDSLGVVSADWGEKMGVNWRVCWKLRLRFGRLVVRISLALNFWKIWNWRLGTDGCSWWMM
jgi:hypothetical protein